MDDKNLFVVIFKAKCCYENSLCPSQDGDVINYIPVLIKNSKKKSVYVVMKLIKHPQFVIDHITHEYRVRRYIGDVILSFKIKLLVQDPIPIAEFESGYDQFKKNKFYVNNTFGAMKFQIFQDLDSYAIE